MLIDHGEQPQRDIGKILEQIEKLLLRRLLHTLRDLNYEYEPLKNVTTKKSDAEPPF